MLGRPLLPVSLSLPPPRVRPLIWQKCGPQALGSVPRVPRVSVSSAGWAMRLVHLGGGREPLSGGPRPVSENQPETRCGSGRCWKAPSPPRLPGLGVLVLPSGGLGWRTMLECSRLSPAQGSLLLSVGHSSLGLHVPSGAGRERPRPGTRGLVKQLSAARFQSALCGQGRMRAVGGGGRTQLPFPCTAAWKGGGSLPHHGGR